MFTTEQAGKALCLTPNNMRKYRFNHNIGKPLGAGNLVQWSIEDLRHIQEIQGRRWNLPKWDVRFQVVQLDGDTVDGTMRIWAKDMDIVRSKVRAWFWHALLKEEPSDWGTPAGFDILSAKCLAIDHKVPNDADDEVFIFNV